MIDYFVYFRLPVFMPQQFLKWLIFFKVNIGLMHKEPCRLEDLFNMLLWKPAILLIIWHVSWKLMRIIQESTQTFWIAMRSCSNFNSSHNFCRIWKKIIWIIWFLFKFSVVKFLVQNCFVSCLLWPSKFIGDYFLVVRNLFLEDLESGWCY